MLSVGPNTVLDPGENEPVWTAEQYNVIFDFGPAEVEAGNTVSQDFKENGTHRKVSFRENYKISECKPTWQKGTLSHWEVVVDGRSIGIKIGPGKDITIAASMVYNKTVTFRAVWNHSVKVGYRNEEKDRTLTKYGIAHKGTYNPPEPKNPPNGSKFKRWVIKDTDRTFTPGGTEILENIEIYAEYEHTVTINLPENGEVNVTVSKSTNRYQQPVTITRGKKFSDVVTLGNPTWKDNARQFGNAWEYLDENKSWMPFDPSVGISRNIVIRPKINITATFDSADESRPADSGGYVTSPTEAAPFNVDGIEEITSLSPE